MWDRLYSTYSKGTVFSFDRMNDAYIIFVQRSTKKVRVSKQ